MVRAFPLSVEVDSSGNLVKCHRTVDNLLEIVTDAMNTQMIPVIDGGVDGLRQELCTPFGANYDASTKMCSFSSSPPPPPPSDSSGPISSTEPIISDMGDLDIEMSQTCTWRYNCAEILPTNVRDVCPASVGAETLHSGVHFGNVPCYRITSRDPIVYGWSRNSCDDARNEAIRLADPNGYATQLHPLAGYMGRVNCDERCYPDLTNVGYRSYSSYRMRCQLQRRFQFVKCFYTNCN